MRRDYDDDGLSKSRDAEGGSRPDLMEALDQLGRRLSGALMLAGGLIAIGIYAGRGGDEAQTYQAFAADGEVFRVNTDSGTIIACNATRCTRILERGQDLAEDQGGTLFKAPPAPQSPANPVQPLLPGQPAAPAAQPTAPAGAPPAPAAPALPSPPKAPAEAN